MLYLALVKKPYLNSDRRQGFTTYSCNLTSAYHSHMEEYICTYCVHHTQHTRFHLNFPSKEMSVTCCNKAVQSLGSLHLEDITKTKSPSPVHWNKWITRNVGSSSVAFYTEFLWWIYISFPTCVSFLFCSPLDGDCSCIFSNISLPFPLFVRGKSRAIIFFRMD